MIGLLFACSLARLLVCLLACSPTCLLAFFGSLCLLILIWFALLTCAARADERQKLNQTMPLRRRLVEFVVFNLLALVWFELARLVIFLDLLACFTLVWFGWFG